MLTIARYSFLLLTLVISVFNCLAQTKKNKYDVAAIYWPGYHPEKRFKDLGVFPDGKGEWEAIYKAKPKSPGHDQPKVPVWGYEDESDPKVMARKISTAVKHGVNVMLFDWYWYENKPFLEDALNKGFLGAPNSKDMQFYLMWANHDLNSYLDPANPDKNKLYWPGGVNRKDFEVMIQHIINDYFKKENYYKINGEPVISIYELSTFIRGMGSEEEAKKALIHFREETIKAGFPGLHLQNMLWSNPTELVGVPGDKVQTTSGILDYFGFQSMTNYTWVHYVAPSGNYFDWGTKGINRWKEFDTAYSIPYCPQVSIAWDNNPRFPVGKQSYVENANAKDFQFFLEKAKEYVDSHPDQPKLIVINAWNEWAEGSMLEPDKTFGYQYLEAIKNVFPPKGRKERKK